MSSITWSARYVLPSISQAAEPAVHELLEHLREEHWSDHDIFSVHLSLEEAVTNAMEHGNRWDASKQVEIELACSPHLLRMEIVDQGSGFDPTAVPDPREEERLEVPRGRGLLIMRSYMTHMNYLDAGRRLVLEKHRVEEADVA